MKMFKYLIPWSPSIIVLDMPSSAKPVKVGLDHGSRMAFWAIIVQETDRALFQFLWVATGETAPNHMTYVDTLIYPNGEVWHLFYDTESLQTGESSNV
jgi:hypothetical protein